MKASALFVVAVFLAAGAEATIESTCKAAGAADKRVDVPFCYDQFNRYRQAGDADVWGLAKIATLIGELFTQNAVYDIGHKVVRPPPGGEAALQQCGKLYNAASFAFGDANQALVERRYAAGKQNMVRAAAITQQCEDAFKKAGLPSPMASYNSDCQKIAVIGVAITNLIKGSKPSALHVV